MEEAEAYKRKVEVKESAIAPTLRLGQLRRSGTRRWEQEEAGKGQKNAAIATGDVRTCWESRLTMISHHTW